MIQKGYTNDVVQTQQSTTNKNTKIMLKEIYYAI